MYTGVQRPNSRTHVGGDPTPLPSLLYSTQILIVSSLSSPSKFVTAISSIPFTITANRVATASNQPQRLSRPVTAPNSRPIACNISESPWSSVGNGPSPTRVVYAFIAPTTRSIRVGGTPAPVHAPPAVVFDEVTYG